MLIPLLNLMGSAVAAGSSTDVNQRHSGDGFAEIFEGTHDGEEQPQQQDAKLVAQPAISEATDKKRSATEVQPAEASLEQTTESRDTQDRDVPQMEGDQDARGLQTLPKAASKERPAEFRGNIKATDIELAESSNGQVVTASKEMPVRPIAAVERDVARPDGMSADGTPLFGATHQLPKTPDRPTSSGMEEADVMIRPNARTEPTVRPSVTVDGRDLPVTPVVRQTPVQPFREVPPNSLAESVTAPLPEQSAARAGHSAEVPRQVIQTGKTRTGPPPNQTVGKRPVENRTGSDGARFELQDADVALPTKDHVNLLLERGATVKLNRDAGAAVSADRDGPLRKARPQPPATKGYEKSEHADLNGTKPQIDHGSTQITSALPEIDGTKATTVQTPRIVAPVPESLGLSEGSVSTPLKSEPTQAPPQADPAQRTNETVPRDKGVPLPEKTAAQTGRAAVVPLEEKPATVSHPPNAMPDARRMRSQDTTGRGQHQTFTARNVVPAGSSEKAMKVQVSAVPSHIPEPGKPGLEKTKDVQKMPILTAEPPSNGSAKTQSDPNTGLEMTATKPVTHDVIQHRKIRRAKSPSTAEMVPPRASWSGAQLDGPSPLPFDRPAKPLTARTKTTAAPDAHAKGRADPTPPPILTRDSSDAPARSKVSVDAGQAGQADVRTTAPNPGLPNATQPQAAPLRPEPSVALPTVAAEAAGGEPEFSDIIFQPIETRTAQSQTSGASAAPLSRAEMAQNILRQIAGSLSQTREGSVEIRLEPEELGRLRMQITPGDQGVAVHVSADRQETLDLMRRNIEQLARELRDLGYQQTSFSFDGQGNRGQRALDQQTAETGPATVQSETANDADIAAVARNAAPGDGLDLRL